VTHACGVKRTGVRAALAVAGALVTALLIAGVFFSVEASPSFRVAPRFALSGWLAALPSHLPWVVPMLLLAAALPALRAWLWGATLRRPAPRYGTRFVAIALGALVNNTVPGRLGLLGSAYVLARRSSRPTSEVFGSLLLMKLLEFAAVVAVTAALLGAAHATGSAPPGFAAPMTAGVVALAAFAGAVAVVARWGPRVSDAAAARPRFPRVAALIVGLRSGLDAVGSARRLAAGFAIGILCVAVAALGYGLALAHVGAPAGLLGGGLVLGAIALGQLTPALPIGPGVHYAIAAWAARALGVEAAEAAALAALSHAATVVAHLAVGSLTALVHRRELAGLIRRGRPAEVPAPAA
jgi:glycosyltransferase 2 family protein